MQRLAILGATGSIGSSTLDIIQSHPQRYRVWALSAFSQMEKLASLARQFLPEVVVVPSVAARDAFCQAWGEHPPHVLIGQEGLCTVASSHEVDTVVCAIVGSAGLPSAYAAAQAGKRILLANKEVLVSAGALFMQAVASSGATLLPLDSEHNAILQCLPASQSLSQVEKVTLTASGGPFRETPLSQLSQVTPEQACRHPNWQMGRKISVDSATMVNKGLEVIEAKYLFNLLPEQIQVLIHPQSVVHALVQYQDGSVLAQLGHHDMRIPISYALAYPDRQRHNAARFDWRQLQQLQFSEPDTQRYPCLSLAWDAMLAGQGACTVLNAANEVAVEAFLQGHLPFTAIATQIEAALQYFGSPTIDTLSAVLATDEQVRRWTASSLQSAY